MNTKILAISILILFLIGCEKKDPENYLEVFYLKPGMSYPMSVQCDWINSDFYKADAKYLKITDSEFISKFMKLYRNYETVEKSSIDVRIQVLVHQKRIVDTLCLGEFFHTQINGETQNDNENLLKLLKTKIDFERQATANSGYQL